LQGRPFVEKISLVRDREEGEREPVSPGMLECDSCGRVTLESEHGWRAVHCIDHHDQVVLVVYCPDCAAAELDGV
jgi:hypothetical protein